MNSFNKYTSLISLKPKDSPEYIDMLRGVLHGSRCVITEKIHGANFSVRTDGTNVVFSRRCADLVEGESFYGYQYISKALSKIALDMFKDLKEMVKLHHEAADIAEDRGEEATRPPVDRNFTTLTIRGELAGGNYLHPDVVQLNGSSGGAGQVGKGSIWYGQDKNFYAFDIEIDGQALDFYDMGAACKSFGVPMAPVLFFGTFEECLAYSTEHLEDDSVVYSMQIMLDANGKFEEPKHLPEIKGNTREGHVIRPVKPMFLPNGKAVILKHKGPKFIEDNEGNPKRVPKAPVELSEELKVIYDAITPLININRLHAVMSKEGEMGPKDFRRACGLVIQDAFAEDSISSQGLANLASDHKQLMNRVMSYTTDELREEFFR